MDNAPPPAEPTTVSAGPLLTATVIGNDVPVKFLLTSSEVGTLPPPRKRPKPLYARTPGARKGRMEKIEDLLHPLIKAGLVKVIRRKFAPPLIQWLTQPRTA